MGKNIFKKGQYKVEVLESSGKEKVVSFTNLEEAIEYANDVASETENGPCYAKVYNENQELIYTGKHYGI